MQDSRRKGGSEAREGPDQTPHSMCRVTITARGGAVLLDCPLWSWQTRKNKKEKKGTGQQQRRSGGCASCSCFCFSFPFVGLWVITRARTHLNLARVVSLLPCLLPHLPRAEKAKKRQGVGPPFFPKKKGFVCTQKCCSLWYSGVARTTTDISLHPKPTIYSKKKTKKEPPDV